MAAAFIPDTLDCFAFARNDGRAAYIGPMTFTADPRRFLYRSDGLDPDAAVRLTAEALGRCDDGELYLQYTASESFGFDDGRLKTADFNTQAGFGLRGVTGETTAFAQANDITESAIRRAAETMAVLDPGKAARQGPPRRTNARLYTDADPLSLIPFARKVALCQEIDAAARARDPRVEQVSVSLAGVWSVIEIVRPDGFVAHDVRPLVRLNVQLMVEQNGRRETGYHGLGGRYLYDELFEPATWNRPIDLALAQALVNLESVAGARRRDDGGARPRLARRAVARGGRARAGGRFQPQGHQRLLRPARRAGRGARRHRDRRRRARPAPRSLTVDDEGTPTQRNVLIEDGILKGYIQDRMNARLMGVEPTGNGRRESFAHAPMPRMTNTFMLAGRDDPSEILARAKNGIYAKSFGGGQVDITSGKFVFSCTEAYRIENGRLGAPIKGATLIGDGPTALTQVKAIGDDMALDEGIGICGKGGQSVPAGVGQPTLLIEGLTVGGTAA